MPEQNVGDAQEPTIEQLLRLHQQHNQMLLTQGQLLKLLQPEQEQRAPEAGNINPPFFQTVHTHN
jgi:hypothetical protein